jgi:hypothetical protein
LSFKLKIYLTESDCTLTIEIASHVTARGQRNHAEMKPSAFPQHKKWLNTLSPVPYSKQNL